MMKNRTFRRIIAGFLLLFTGYFAVIFVHGWYSDWQPPEGPTPLAITRTSAQTTISDSILCLATWNVGYGGLGAESDFFYDDAGMWYSGSSMIRSPRPLVEKNLRGAVDFLKNTKADFFLLQEVDLESDRSCRIRQFDEYEKALPGFAATFAENYKCDRVPIPLLEPWHAYGSVLSDSGTLSRFQPSESIRYQIFPVNIPCRTGCSSSIAALPCIALPRTGEKTS